MATLHLICGLPGAGKTTLARRLERERPAVVLSPDPTLRAIFGGDRGTFTEEHRDQVERLLREVGLRALELGLDVVLDNGFWGRAERDELRAAGRAIGAEVVTYYLDVGLDELWRRLQERNATLDDEHADPAHLRVHPGELEQWDAIFERPTADEEGVVRIAADRTDAP